MESGTTRVRRRACAASTRLSLRMVSCSAESSAAMRPHASADTRRKLRAAFHPSSVAASPAPASSAGWETAGTHPSGAHAGASRLWCAPNIVAATANTATTLNTPVTPPEIRRCVQSPDISRICSRADGATHLP